MFKDIKIDKGVDIPRPMKEASGICAALRRMEIGDSFMLPSSLTGSDSKALQSNISAQCCQFSRGKKFKFTVRKVDGGYRVWMISRNATT